MDTDDDVKSHNVDDITDRESFIIDPMAVQENTVGASRILDAPAVCIVAELGVITGNGRLGIDDFICFQSADADHGIGKLVHKIRGIQVVPFRFLLCIK